MLTMVNMCMMLLAVLSGINNGTTIVPVDTTSFPEICSKFDTQIKPEYTIVSSPSYNEFLKKTNNLMTDNWVPQGGVNVHGVGYKNQLPHYTQAFVKNT
jgi:hypothetical protein